jgi:Flp pilus assembly protein TadG
VKIKDFIAKLLQNESGQAAVLVALAMGIFLLGAVGLAIDGSHLYAQYQMAQSAADAAAEAGIMSIFDGTNNNGQSTAFSTAGSFTCGIPDARTPCAFAEINGFNVAGDTVTVSFPADSTVPGVNFSNSDPTNLIQVTIQRQVKTTLMKLLGPSLSTIQVTAMAAIVDVVAPTPIIVAHPTMTGSFSTNGGILITICGGPKRSVQINSNATTAITTAGSGTVDLSHAGPPDPGDCSTGTGADFGTFGGPSSPPFIYLGGSTGTYLQPASPIEDPLDGVPAPPIPSYTPPDPPSSGTTYQLNPGQNGCPAAPLKQCYLYSPGLYPAGLNGKNETMVFAPGIYYVQNGGVSCTANCSMYMATAGTPDSGSNSTNTGWTDNIMIYNSGSGSFNIGANGNVGLPGSPLIGSPDSSIYKGILFFEDHTSPANTGANANSMGGGGALQLQGTIYLTNSKDTMLGDATHYQELDLQGTPGSQTKIRGRIIVDALNMGGNAAIEMDLSSTANTIIREVALVQ